MSQGFETKSADAKKTSAQKKILVITSNQK
jgi:hypothetical protein